MVDNPFIYSIISVVTYLKKSAVILYSSYTRALTFEKLNQRCVPVMVFVLHTRVFVSTVAPAGVCTPRGGRGEATDGRQGPFLLALGCLR